MYYILLNTFFNIKCRYFLHSLITLQLILKARGLQTLPHKDHLDCLKECCRANGLLTFPKVLKVVEANKSYTYTQVINDVNKAVGMTRTTYERLSRCYGRKRWRDAINNCYHYQ